MIKKIMIIITTVIIISIIIKAIRKNKNDENKESKCVRVGSGQ
jgi:hypothetical protein